MANECNLATEALENPVIALGDVLSERRQAQVMKWSRQTGLPIAVILRRALLAGWDWTQEYVQGVCRERAADRLT